MKGGEALQFLHDLRRAIGGPDPQKDMDVIGLDRQGENVPAFLLALLTNELPAAFFERAYKNGFTPFRAPDEMVDDQVNPVLISLVLYCSGIRRFHSDCYTLISTKYNKQGLKP